ncbi:proton-conducting transporter membrane subunit [Trujillonella humicola]|uniref:proton-conducting transporter transmembrane domain-containing protein n=1 Tax=Trujillonella humicola TaxID=3383699 RepID=UPI003906D3D0
MTGLWAAALLAPLLLAAAATAAPLRGAVVALAPVACLPALVLAALGERAGGVDLPWLLLGTRLEVDAVGRPLLLLTALLYCVALAAGRVERAADPRRAGFTGIFLLAYTGNVALLVAADAITFYVGFTVMSLAAWGLVAHTRTSAALRAGRVYVGLAVLGEVLLLAGLVAAMAAAGTPPTGTLLADLPGAVAAAPGREVIVVLLVAGLGVKVGLVPLHAWLPLAHPAAPAPASAVLSGAMVKAGLVGWLRLLPLGEAALPFLGGLLVGLGVAGIFLGVAAGLLQDDPKVQLAYSTVSQMGFIAVAVGIGLREPALAGTAISVAAVYAVAHGLAKGALFLAVPVWHSAASPARRRLTLAGVAVAALALAGLAPLGGFVAKYGLKELADAAGLPVLLLAAGAVGTTLLMARFAVTLAGAPVDAPRPAGVVEAGWVLLLVAGPALTWLVGTGLADAPVPGGLDASTWDATWPVLLGAGLAGAAATRTRLAGERSPRGRPGPRLPAGDVVVVLEPATVGTLRGLDAAGRLPGAAVAAAAARTRGAAPSLQVWGDRLALPAWRYLGPLSLATLVLLVALLW